MISFDTLIADYERTGRPHLRLGQFFCNKYLKDPHAIPNLFNIHRDYAEVLITQWLIDNQYVDLLPQPTENWKKANLK